MPNADGNTQIVNADGSPQIVVASAQLQLDTCTTSGVVAVQHAIQQLQIVNDNADDLTARHEALHAPGISASGGTSVSGGGSKMDTGEPDCICTNNPPWCNMATM